MYDIVNLNLDYNEPVKIAEGVYWIGFCDRDSGLHCNPYLIVDGDEAVVIDGGSRPDFPVVMMKILKTGTPPTSIKSLIYHHYDPDLCGSIPNFEDIIGKRDLMIVSEHSNLMFIRHYYTKSKLISIAELKDRFTFSSGRTLQFITTPYCHAWGSFVTFDEKTGILFSSDIFGSYGKDWSLFLRLDKDCRTCLTYKDGKCPNKKKECPLANLLQFNQNIMTSERALRFALEKLSDVPFRIIAPQHGSVIYDLYDIKTVFDVLVNAKDVGIDRYLGSRAFSEIGKIEKIREKLE